MEETVRKIGTIRGTFNIRHERLLVRWREALLYLVAMLEPCHSSNERHLHFSTHAHACDLK